MSTSVANLGEQARSAGVTAKREKKGKKITLYRFVRQVELKISPTKTEVFPVSISAPLPIKIGQLHLTTTQHFTCWVKQSAVIWGWWMFDRGLVMLEEPLQNYDLCRRAESTAKTQ
jgi:hypothetical protein